MAKKTNWTMPEWMQPFAQLIGNTGGNDVADLINQLANNDRLSVTNFPVFVLAVAVESQVHLLERLHDAGLLAEPDGSTKLIDILK